MLAPLYKASCALLLILLQCILACAAPASACCAGRAHLEAVKSVDGEADCCPPGSHAPGECPLHKKAAKSPAAAALCRMRCSASHAPDFVLGAIGVLPGPSMLTFSAASASPFQARLTLAPLVRPALPDAPPPKAL